MGTHSYSFTPGGEVKYTFSAETPPPFEGANPHEIRLIFGGDVYVETLASLRRRYGPKLSNVSLFILAIGETVKNQQRTETAEKQT